LVYYFGDDDNGRRKVLATMLTLAPATVQAAGASGAGDDPTIGKPVSIADLPSPRRGGVESSQ